MSHCGPRTFSGNDAKPCGLSQILSGSCKRDKGNAAWESRTEAFNLVLETKQFNPVKERLFVVTYAFQVPKFKDRNHVYWLVLHVNLKQAGVLIEKGASGEEMPP